MPFLDLTKQQKRIRYNQMQPPEVFYKKKVRPTTLLKKRLWHRNFVNRTLFLQNTSGGLL